MITWLGKPTLGFHKRNILFQFVPEKNLDNKSNNKQKISIINLSI